MTCYVKLHPWDAFLKARLGAILFLQKDGKTMEEIAEILSMDAEQVSAVIKSNFELCHNERYKAFHHGGDFFYAPYVDKESDE